MQSLAGFRSSHVELRCIIGELQSLLSADALAVPSNAKTAYGLLCKLSDLVSAHLAAEDKGLYPSLLTHEDFKVKSLAWGFISGERPLRRVFCEYRQRWLKECDFSFSDAFLAESRKICTLLQERIDREEHLLFPKLEEIRAYPRPAPGALHSRS
jgi:hypothetical protein